MLMICAALSFLTGIVMFFMKYGMWLVFTRAFLRNLHACSSFVMAFLIVIHIFLNRRIYKNELAALRKKEKS